MRRLLGRWCTSWLILAPALVAGAGLSVPALAQTPCDFNVDFCKSTFRPGMLLLQYSGTDCASSAHGQPTDSVSCAGDPAGANPVRVLVIDRSDPNDVAAKRWFDGVVGIGDVFTVNARNAGETTLGAQVWAFIYSGSTLLQTVSFQTSCRHPLKEGNQFGALRLTRPRFPQIPVWSHAQRFVDGSATQPRNCLGSFPTPADSLVSQERTATLRFLRDRVAEARSDFGGYRIYRATVSPDTSRMVLLRRYSTQQGDDRLWNFSVVDTSDSTTLPLRCNGAIVHDSVVTFLDPDSSANFVKVPCRDPNTGVIRPGCVAAGDSIFILVPPPGPHNGFRTYYSVTYELRNLSIDAGYEDMFVPDTLGIIDTCGVAGDLKTCPNLNNKCYNLTHDPVEPTEGPSENTQRVGVVPNPYRARASWDRPGSNELHFVNLPSNAVIKIYTASGDLVREIEHADQVRDFARWDLKNQSGNDVSSGIYLFRIESTGTPSFTFQDRFVVIR